MAFDIEQPITSAKDVKAFFNYLNVVEKCNFHPDDDFSDHIKHGTEEQAFDATKAAVLNARMAEAKQVCGDDVYEIAVDVFRQNQEKLKKEANGGTIVALPVLQFEKGGSVSKLSIGQKYGDWSVTQYNPVVHEESGGTRSGLVKLVNQDTFDEVLIQYDGSLRNAKWFTKTDGKAIEGQTPEKVIEKLKLATQKAKGGGAGVSPIRPETIRAIELDFLSDKELYHNYKGIYDSDDLENGIQLEWGKYGYSVAESEQETDRSRLYPGATKFNERNIGKLYAKVEHGDKYNMVQIQDYDMLANDEGEVSTMPLKYFNVLKKSHPKHKNVLSRLAKEAKKAKAIKDAEVIAEKLNLSKEKATLIVNRLSDFSYFAFERNRFQVYSTRNFLKKDFKDLQEALDYLKSSFATEVYNYVYANTNDRNERISEGKVFLFGQTMFEIKFNRNGFIFKPNGETDWSKRGVTLEMRPYFAINTGDYSKQEIIAMLQKGIDDFLWSFNYLVAPTLKEHKKNGGQMVDAQEFPKEIVIDGHLMRFDKGSDTHLAEFKKQKMAGAKEIYWYDPFHAYQFADGEIKIYLDSNFINKTAKDLKEAKFIVDNLAKGAGYGKEYLENTFVREERGRSYITTPIGPYTNALEYVPGKKEQAIKVLELRKEGANLTVGMKSGGTLHVKRFKNGELKAYTKDELKNQYPKDLSFEAKKKLFLEGKLSKSESEYKSSLIKYVDWSETYIQKIEIDGKSFYVFMFREPSSPLTIQMWHSSSLESLENRIKSHNEISDSISFSPRFPKFQEEDEFIQAVIFNKKQMQKSDARAFLNKYGFSLNMEETTNFYKHNERNENLFDKDSFHIKEIQPGIKLVIAKLKK